MIREMAGLCALLETKEEESAGLLNDRTQVINKTSLLRSPMTAASFSFPATTPSFSRRPASGADFLDRCFLCRQKLSPGRDIYMYKGDEGFCSVECRYRQIFMDEQETVRRENHCALSAMSQPASPPPPSSSLATPAAASGRRHRKGTGADGAPARFVY